MLAELKFNTEANHISGPWMGRQQAGQPDVILALSRLRVWERAGVRAPHKPLLILYALGRWVSGQHSIRFADAAGKLKELLEEFGPARRSYHPEYPFWYLQTDGIWQVRADKPLTYRTGKSQPTAGELIRQNAIGEFTPAIRAALNADPTLVARIAHELLDAHFPASIHTDILAAVGLDADAMADAPAGRPRDPQFREMVLIAYGCQCAVCGLGIRLGLRPVALDAAHIKWHAAGGPDAVANGLCLCSLHHKLFDLGAFTIEPELGIVRVSERLNGDGIEKVLLLHEGQPVRRPRRDEAYPAANFLTWHAQQVFHR